MVATIARSAFMTEQDRRSIPPRKGVSTRATVTSNSLTTGRALLAVADSLRVTHLEPRLWRCRAAFIVVLLGGWPDQPPGLTLHKVARLAEIGAHFGEL